MNNKLMFALIFGIMLLGMASAITVTLNSPADGSTQFYQNITNNVSFSTTNGVTPTNLTLYNNASGTFTNVSTTTYANWTLNDPESTTNPYNFFDMNDTTYAQKTGGPSTTANLGKIFSSSRYVGNVRIKAVATTTTGADTAQTSVVLQAYNGTVWSSVTTLETGTNTATYDNTYALNSMVSGIRIQLNGASGAGAAQDHKFYTLDYNETITQTFNSAVAIGTNLWNAYGCGSDGVCTFATSNRTFNVDNVSLNNFTYNATSYETAYESYVANISADTGLTAVALQYNGTDYTMTQSGSSWTYSKNLLSSNIGNNSIRLKYTYGADTIYSDYYYQNVSSANISACNGVYTTKYINFSFLDEATLLPVNSQITNLVLNYKLHPSATAKTLTYSNTTEVPFYTFCGIPTDRTYYIDYSISYKNGTTYPQRIAEISSTAFTNATTNTTLYLLSSSTGIYVTFQVTNQADQLLSGVSVNATRVIGSTNVTVAQGTTSAAGTVTFWLNPDALHTFTFAKTGYTTYSYSDYPTQASYTVILSSGSTQTQSDYTKGITKRVYPSSGDLVNDTTYNFNFTLASTYWDVSEFGFYLYLSNGTVLGSTSSATNGGFVSLNLGTSNYSRIYMNYYYLVNSTYMNDTTYWNTFNGVYTGWSIKTFFDDFKLYMGEGDEKGMFGIDKFGRAVIIFLILFISVGIMSYKFGTTSPTGMATILFAVVFFFDFVLGLIPNPVGFIANAPTWLALIILIGVILSENLR